MCRSNTGCVFLVRSLGCALFYFISFSGGIFMFVNIGGKIKKLSESLTLIGITLSLIAAIAIMCFMKEIGIVIGIVVGVIGSLVSWYGSFALYGYGQLIENSDKLASMSETPKHDDHTTKAGCRICDSTDSPLCVTKLSTGTETIYVSVCPACINKYDLELLSPEQITPSR